MPKKDSNKKDAAKPGEEAPAGGIEEKVEAASAAVAPAELKEEEDKAACAVDPAKPDQDAQEHEQTDEQEHGESEGGTKSAASGISGGQNEAVDAPEDEDKAVSSPEIRRRARKTSVVVYLSDSDDEEIEDKNILGVTKDVTVFAMTEVATVTKETLQVTQNIFMNGVPSTFTYLRRSFLQQLGANLIPAFTTALVNVPLSISLGIASGATPTMGCISSIWAGFFSAVFGGSGYNVVGATGALTGILYEASASWGEPELYGSILPVLALMTGAMVLVVFWLKLDKFAQFVPQYTMQGFTIGVAIIIALNQLNFALGLPRGCPPGSIGLSSSAHHRRGGAGNDTHLPLPNSTHTVPQVVYTAGVNCIQKHAEFLETVAENLSHSDLVEYPALACFFVFFVVQFMLKWNFPRIPWAVPLAFIGIIVGYVGSTNPETLGGYHIQTLETRFPGIKMDIAKPITASSDRLFSRTETGGSMLWECVQTSLSITIIVVLEALISARICDCKTKTHFNQRQEVFGVALANIATGLAGGHPATAGLAATKMNLMSGGKGRMSVILQPIFVGILSMALMPLFKFLPLPVVAALLVNVSWGMMEWQEMGHIWSLDKNQFGLMVFVAIFCVCVEATLAIILGTFISLILFTNKISRGQALCTIWEGTNKLADFDADYCIEDVPFEMIRPKKEKIFEDIESELQDRIFGGQSETDLPPLGSFYDNGSGNPSFQDDNLSSIVVEGGANASKKGAESPAIGKVNGKAKAGKVKAAPGKEKKLVKPRKNKKKEAFQHEAAPFLVLEYRIVGRLNFVTAETHSKRLRIIQEPSLAILMNFSQVKELDVDGIFQLEILMEELNSHGKVVFWGGLRSRVKALMRTTHIYEKMEHKHRLIDGDYINSIGAFVLPKDPSLYAYDDRLKADLAKVHQHHDPNYESPDEDDDEEEEEESDPKSMKGTLL